MLWEVAAEWREGQKMGEREEGAGEVESFADMALSLEVISDCFWVRLLRASVVAARSEISVEAISGKVASLSMDAERQVTLIKS